MSGQDLVMEVSVFCCTYCCFDQRNFCLLLALSTEQLFRVCERYKVDTNKQHYSLKIGRLTNQHTMGISMDSISLYL